MPTLVRKQIYLDPDVDVALKKEAKRRGLSQAAVIRERLRYPGRPPLAARDPKARLALLDVLKQVQAEASGPGTGWKFNRDEVYAERLERQYPRGHKRPGVRGRHNRGE